MGVDSIAKKMEKWHNIVFPIIWYGAFFGMVGLITLSSYAIFFYMKELYTAFNFKSTDPFIIDVLLFISAVGIFLLPIVLVYVKIFMKFSFPIKDKGDGHGKTIKPPEAKL